MGSRRGSPGQPKGNTGRFDKINFPFTAFVMAAAALQYSRVRLLAIVAITRTLRFILLGILAFRFGAKILQWGKSPVVQGLLIGIIVL